MIRRATLLLRDIEENIRFIAAVLVGRTIDDFRTDTMFRYALLHAFLIVAEASKNLPPELQAAHPGVPWRKVIGLGNILRHEYHRIDPTVIWEAATVYLPAVQATIKRMIAEDEDMSVQA